jgi:hypothetical protein
MMISPEPLVIGKNTIELHNISFCFHLFSVNHCIKVRLVLLCFLMNLWKVSLIAEGKTKLFKTFTPVACAKVSQVASAGLFTDVKYHEALFSVIQYLPECTIFGRGANIGGIQYATDASMYIISFSIFQIYSFVYV